MQATRVRKDSGAGCHAMVVVETEVSSVESVGGTAMSSSSSSMFSMSMSWVKWSRRGAVDERLQTSDATRTERSRSRQQVVKDSNEKQKAKPESVAKENEALDLSSCLGDKGSEVGRYRLYYVGQGRYVGGFNLESFFRFLFGFLLIQSFFLH